MYGKIIKELRIQRKMNQTQLAKILGVNQTAIGKYEREELDLNTSTLITLAVFFDVTTDYILGLENEDGTRNTKFTSNLTFNGGNNNIIQTYNF